MKLLRRMIAWGFYGVFLYAVGMVVFVLVRHTPRCTITGPLKAFHLSVDGSRLATHVMSKDDVAFGPLQVWDTQNGKVIHAWFDQVGLRDVATSPDGRYVAVSLANNSSRLLDLQSAQEFTLDHTKDIVQFQFSPNGQWVYMTGLDGKPSFLVNVPERRVVQSFEALQPAAPFFSNPLFAGLELHRPPLPHDRLLLLVNPKENGITVWDLEANKHVAKLDIGKGFY